MNSTVGPTSARRGSRESTLRQVRRVLCVIAWFRAHPDATLMTTAERFGTTVPQLREELTRVQECGLPGLLPGSLVDLTVTGPRVVLNETLGVDRPLALTAAEAGTLELNLEKLASILAAYQQEPLPRVLGIDVRAPHRTAQALRDHGHDDPLLRLVAEHAELGERETIALAGLCARIEQAAAPQAADLARNLGRHVDAYLAAPDLARLHRRDTHMAGTLLENLPGRGITVVWAHNEHIARNPDFYGGPSMGTVLDAELGRRYVPVGLMCGEGEARAVDPSTGDDSWRTVPLPPLRAGTTDAALAALGAGLVTRESFSHSGPRRFLGWRIDTSLFGDADAARASFEIERPSSDFDGLVMLGRSTADVTAELPEP